jgi:hypothetical protein
MASSAGCTANADQMYLDRAHSDTTRARPGLGPGPRRRAHRDTPVVPKLDRPIDARHPADQVAAPPYVPIKTATRRHQPRNRDGGRSLVKDGNGPLAHPAEAKSDLVGRMRLYVTGVEQEAVRRR